PRAIFLSSPHHAVLILRPSLSHPPAPSQPSTLSLHDALPILATTEVAYLDGEYIINPSSEQREKAKMFCTIASTAEKVVMIETRSEEHTSELQSRFDLVCRLLLEKKKRRTHRLSTVSHCPRQF